MIEASPTVIWGALRLYPRAQTYHAVITRIDAVAGHPDQFDMVFDQRVAQSEDVTPVALRVKVTDQVPGECQRHVPVNAEKFPFWSQDVESSELFLKPVDGGAKVTIQEL